MKRIIVLGLAVGLLLSMGAKGCAGKQQNAYGDGMYDVGVNLPPGLYHTAGKGRRHPCSYSVERGDHKMWNRGFVGKYDLRVDSDDRAYSFHGGCIWHKVA